MKKTMSWILTIVFAFAFIFNGFSQKAPKDDGETKDLKKIWLSMEAPGDKAAAVNNLKLKVAELTLPDMYAYTLMLFQAEQLKDANIRSMVQMVQKFETLPPSGKKELNEQYPKIVVAYESFAEKKMSIFHFQAELKQPITFSELAEKPEKGAVEPFIYDELMRFYTIAMQHELYASRNIVILPTYKKIAGLWSSLTQAQKEALDQAGYPNFWKEQISLYNHKFSNKTWACTCGTDQSVFPNLSDCGNKTVPIKEDEKKLDEATQMLIKFNQGDLSSLKVYLRNPAVTNYSGSKDNIVRQLVFLHLASLNPNMINSGMKVSLVSLWDKGKDNSNNDYLNRIGLTREALVDLESYYTCLLSMKSAAPNQPKDIADIATDTSGIPIPEVKELIKETPPRIISRTETLKKISPKINIVEMRDVWDAAVQNEITNRENLKLCAETHVVNDSTLELDLKGCGDGKGTFKILETETPLVGEFFSYCTNALSDLLVSYKKDVKGTYKVHITGTADTLGYHDNQSLANARAEFVKANLGRKLVADCENEDITTEGLTEQEERKVTIRVTLYKPHS